MDNGIFQGGVFDPNLPGGRAGVEIECTASGIVAKTAESREYKISWSALRLTLGGNSGRMWFLRGATQDPCIFCEDSRFTAALRENAGSDVSQEVTALLKTGRSQGRRSLMLWILSAAALVLLIWGILIGLGFVARKTAQNLPVSFDKKIGDMAWAQMERQEEMTDEAVVSAITTIVERLKPQISNAKDFDFRVVVVRSSQVNAFALPGGRIAVFTGLLKESSSAEQVAGVIAHEMAHVSHRHSMQAITRSIGLIVGIQILVGDVGGLIALGGDLAARAAMNSYSRDHEREADAAAVLMLHSAGLDPKEYATFFAVMDKLPGANSIPHWMSSHPGNQERIENIKKDVEKLGPVKLQPLGIDWSGIPGKCGAVSATSGKILSIK